jgi:hypothetical protein
MATLTESGSARERRAEKIQVIELVLDKVKQHLTRETNLKATIADFVRLMELKRELDSEGEQDEITEIKITWVEPKQPATAQ